MLNLRRIIRRRANQFKIRRRTSYRADTHLAFEQLESRRLLTVVFTPQFGAETLVSGPPFTGTIHSPKVHLLLWGNTWDAAGGPASAPVINEAKAILNSTYFLGMIIYGGDGLIGSFDSYVDSASSPTSSLNPGNLSGSSLTEALQELTSVTNNGHLPHQTSSSDIYVIVTDPANSVSSGGYNTIGSFLFDNICSMGTSGSGSAINSIQFGQDFSHELAERITSASVSLNLPAGFPANLGFNTSQTQQVADGEAEPQNQPHYYLPLMGAYVQPFWSYLSNAFVVPDGNSEVFTLNPIWNTRTNVFSGTFNLVVNGDQNANKDDSMTIGLDSTGSNILVTLDNQTAEFARNEIASITFNALTGNNTLTMDNSHGDAFATGRTVKYNGGLGSNTLVGPNTDNAWRINGAFDGILNNSVTFVGVANLKGGSGADGFLFIQSAELENIDGGGGTNTLDFGAWTGSPIIVNLQTDAVPGILAGKFSNINKLVGTGTGSDTLYGPDADSVWTVTSPVNGSVAGVTFSNFAFLAGGSGTDTLVGPDGGATWQINGPDTGQLGAALTFSGMENLTGGSGDDQFEFSASGSISGSIDGNGGNNTLDFSQLAGPITVNLQTGAVTNVVGSFSNISNVAGSTSSADLLVGPDNSYPNWVLTGSNAGNVAGMAFSSFENLQGGAQRGPLRVPCWWQCFGEYRRRRIRQYFELRTVGEPHHRKPAERNSNRDRRFIQQHYRYQRQQQSFQQSNRAEREHAVVDRRRRQCDRVRRGIHRV